MVAISIYLIVCQTLLMSMFQVLIFQQCLINNIRCSGIIHNMCNFEHFYYFEAYLRIGNKKKRIWKILNIYFSDILSIIY